MFTFFCLQMNRVPPPMYPLLIHMGGRYPLYSVKKKKITPQKYKNTVCYHFKIFSFFSLFIL